MKLTRQYKASWCPKADAGDDIFGGPLWVSFDPGRRSSKMDGVKEGLWRLSLHQTRFLDTEAELSLGGLRFL